MLAGQCCVDDRSYRRLGPLALACRQSPIRTLLVMPAWQLGVLGQTRRDIAVRQKMYSSWRNMQWLSMDSFWHSNSRSFFPACCPGIVSYLLPREIIGLATF